jgi:hypothetical protein
MSNALPVKGRFKKGDFSGSHQLCGKNHNRQPPYLSLVPVFSHKKTNVRILKTGLHLILLKYKTDI